MPKPLCLVTSSPTSPLTDLPQFGHTPPPLKFYPINFMRTFPSEDLPHLGFWSDAAVFWKIYTGAHKQGLKPQGLKPQIFREYQGEILPGKSGLFGTYRCFFGADRDQVLLTSQPQGKNRNCPERALLAQLAPFGPSPHLPSPRLDFPRPRRFNLVAEAETRVIKKRSRSKVINDISPTPSKHECTERPSISPLRSQEYEWFNCITDLEKLLGAPSPQMLPHVTLPPAPTSSEPQLLSAPELLQFTF